MERTATNTSGMCAFSSLKTTADVFEASKYGILAGRVQAGDCVPRNIPLGIAVNSDSKPELTLHASI